MVRSISALIALISIVGVVIVLNANSEPTVITIGRSTAPSLASPSDESRTDNSDDEHIDQAAEANGSNVERTGSDDGDDNAVERRDRSRRRRKQSQRSRFSLVEAKKELLWTAGTGGYDRYLSPSITSIGEQTVFVFCEGQTLNGDQVTDSNLLLRRSEDGGATWAESIVVLDNDAPCINPCVLVDRSTEMIILLATLHGGAGIEDRLVQLSSTDAGISWLAITDITDQVNPQGWSGYMTGPGQGIQLRLGDHAGRLIVPCTHQDENDESIAHLIVSDDRGSTWQLAEGMIPGYVHSQVLEQADGDLLLSLAPGSDTEPHHRFMAISNDGGRSWSEPKPTEFVKDPGIQAGLTRLIPVDRLTEDDDPELILTNPTHVSERFRLMAWISSDDGETWTRAKTIHSQAAGASACLCLDNGIMICVFEGGDSFDAPEEFIAVIRFDRPFFFADLGKTN